MATSKQIRISITSALNAAGIEATKAQVESMSKAVAKSMGEAAQKNRTHWADIKAAWDMGTAAIAKAWGAIRSALSSAFRFETQTTQFKTLIGNIDEARAHMADLKALGDTPPFSLDEFAKASRSLMVMTDGALGYKKSLEMIGDAAAATGNPIEQMGHAVGRLFAVIRDGQPISRAVMELKNMGVITPEVAQKLQDLQAAGKSNAEIWAEVEAQLGRYKGAMAETEKTGEGLMGAIKSRWDNIVRAFGHAFEDSAKDGMGEVLEAMEDLEESGAIERWASAAVAALDKVAGAARSVGGWFGKIMDHLNQGRNAWKEIREEEAAAAEDGSETFTFDREETVNPYTRKRYYLGSEGSERVETIEDQAAKKKYEREMREQERLAKEKEREEREAARIAEELAEAQKKKEERDAQEAAEKKAAEDKKAAEKAAAERARLDAQEAARRERERQAELAARIKEHQQLLAAERAEESKTRAAASAAESKLQQAWGWYRNQDAMAAQMEEEKADAAAREQFEKDFDRLKSRRRDWRTAENLSVADEAVRRVAIAREEKEAAEQHLAEIEKNTANLAEKLDQLLQVKG